MGLLGRVDASVATKVSGGMAGYRATGRASGTALACLWLMVTAGGALSAQTPGGTPESTPAASQTGSPATSTLPAVRGQTSTPASEPTNSAVPSETTPDQVI